MQSKLLLLFLASLYISISAQSKKEKEIDSLFSTIKSKANNPYVKKETDKILKVSTEVYYKSREINYIDGQIDALSYMTEIYTNTGNTKMALAKADEGIALAGNNKKYTIDKSNLLIAKGAALSKLGYFDKAIRTFKEALDAADKAPPEDNNIKHYNKSLTYFLIRLLYERDRNAPLDKKETEFYIQSAYKEACQISPDYKQKAYIMTKSLQSLISAYTDWGELNKAEAYLAEGDKINESTESTWPLTRNVLLGEMETKRKNFSKAAEHFKIALDLTKSYKLVYDQKLMYSLLAESYHELQDYKNESYYLAQNKKLSDSLSKAEKQTNSYILKKELETKVPDKIWENPINWYYIVPFIILSIIVIYTIYKRFKKQKISGSVIDYNTELDYGGYEDHKKLDHVIELAENNNTAFYLKFQEIFPDFNQKLLNINPRLTQSDLEYCAMMKLNFDTKKIAIIKKTSVGAVESKKHRIRKKLNITSEENIYIWLIDK
ncbi:tetratricopeptide repeat protein [Elizabethkingia occulta]|uniref:HTH luxR-type domain-containing protein n=1 Tax=Elizabethkingia occulta TaxID=1867263 RepID=A0A1T3MA48_9FLAO|nr:tetratricopeptide repeat protein [Elizabethkingia occulta]OPB86497.1 hypothetical protein BB020_06175 [Elizabethkingia occulta]OPC61151.1 hypothetical protein BAZ10_11855 [Elizabethkingia occulta]